MIYPPYSLMPIHQNCFKDLNWITGIICLSHNFKVLIFHDLCCLRLLDYFNTSNKWVKSAVTVFGLECTQRTPVASRGAATGCIPGENDSLCLGWVTLTSCSLKWTKLSVMYTVGMETATVAGCLWLWDLFSHDWMQLTKSSILD